MAFCTGVPASMNPTLGIMHRCACVCVLGGSKLLSKAMSMLSLSNQTGNLTARHWTDVPNITHPLEARLGLTTTTIDSCSRVNCVLEHTSAEQRS